MTRNTDCKRNELDAAECTSWTDSRRRNAMTKRPLIDPKHPAARIARSQLQLGKRPPLTTKVSREELRQQPQDAVGKLFFHWYKNDYVGSAWVSNTPAGKAVFTAAHNVFDQEKDTPAVWSDDICFALQYDDGEASREINFKRAITLSGWNDAWNFAYDFAILIPKSPIDDWPALDYLLDATLPSYKALGYPDKALPEYPFDGQCMWSSVGDFVSAADGVMGCMNNLTEGSSGGPWCTELDGRWHANGVQSHGMPDSADVSFSPQFCEASVGALLHCAGLTTRASAERSEAVTV